MMTLTNNRNSKTNIKTNIKTNLKVKLTRSLMLLLFSITFFACTSAPKNSMERDIVPDTKDYVIRERYPSEIPEWKKNFNQFKKQQEIQGQFYFIGESGDVLDRIDGCDYANMAAKKQISQQIAEFIEGKIASSKAGSLFVDKEDSSSNRLGHHFTNTLASKTMAFLSGVKQFDQYWEERDYSPSGGRKRIYQCAVIVVIDEKNLAAAIKRSSKKAQEIPQDQEAKNLVKEALSSVDTQLDESIGHSLSVSVKNTTAKNNE